jgi:hypothetical protein
MTSQPLTVPAAARALATELTALFTHDKELARQLNDAHTRLRDANERLWSGLHPDAHRLLNNQEHAAQRGAPVPGHSHVTTLIIDALRSAADERQLQTMLDAELQEIHWAVHHAFVDYQSASEERRQLAVDAGELGHRLVDALIAAGWTDTQARNANVDHLAEGNGPCPLPRTTRSPRSAGDELCR